MRFIKDDPSIPDELLVARDEGRVVFFCGAGVSRAFADLPDFFELANDVIQNLRVSEDDPVTKLLNEAEEIHKRTGVDGLISADRMFGLLERDYTAKDIEHAVAQALKPDPRPYYLSAHRTLIDLATTPEGKVRIVTTNLDRLFERCNNKLTVWKPPKLPDPSRPNELDGIVYLHGCTNQDYNGSEGDGFILSSAGFGRAYLSEGWATAFIKEILNRYIVVFIGYSADDPPIHYLLEALNQHGQPSGLYAFQDGTEDGATARWEHKGVEAIAYSADDGHRALWKTLEEWAQRARNPDQWIQSVISLAMKGPECLEPHERGQVAHIISTSVGAKIFQEANSPLPAEWLCVFDAFQRYANPGSVGAIGSDNFIDPFDLYGLDSDTVPKKVNPDDVYAQTDKREVPSNAWDAFSVNKYDQQNLNQHRFAAIQGYLANNISMLSDRQNQIGAWISNVADQPACLWWAAKQSGLHPGIQQQIKHRFRYRKIIRSDIHQAWQYLFENWDRQINHFDDEIFDLERETNQYGWNCAVARKYIAITRPYLKVEQSYDYRSVPPKGNDCQRINNLVRLDVEYPSPNEHDFNIPDEWLAFIVRELRKNLEIALQLETEIGGFGLSVGFSGPIIPEDCAEIGDYQRSHGLSGSVILFSQLFERLINLDISIARQEFSTWPVDDENIFARLRIWVGGKQEFVSAQTFSDIVLALNDDTFWARNHQRDLLLALATRWNELHINSRNTIEQRLLRGREKWLNGEDDQRKWNAYNSLNRITWLAKHECNLSFDFEVEVNRLKHIVPFWKPEDAEKAASSNESRGGLVGTDPEYSSLLEIPLGSVLSIALELSENNEDILTKKDPFSGLSNHHPVRALTVLGLAARHNEFPQWAWSAFLHSEGRENDKPKLSALIGERLCCYPDNAIIEFIHPASHWLIQTSEQLASQYPHTFDKIILKLVNVIASQPSTNSTGLVRGNREADWIMEAINAPIGKIAQAIFNDPRRQPQENSNGLSDEWLQNVEKLFSMDDDLFRYVLVIFCHSINWFYAVDPDWTERNLLAVLNEDNKHNQEAFWAGLFWSAQVPNQTLYTRLKPYLLSLTKQQSLTNNKYRNIHAGIVLAGWGSTNTDTQERFITNDEMRKQLLDGGDDFGSSVLWKIKHWSDNPGNNTIDWSKQLLKFFRDAWPRQRSAKTSTLSALLCKIAASNIDYFCERIEVILPLLTTISHDQIYQCNLNNLNNNIVKQYPDKTLELLHTILPNEAGSWPHTTGEILQTIYDEDDTFKLDERLLELKRKWNAR
ncbi:MAG: SIR2 family protein [Methylococcales bacterium]